MMFWVGQDISVPTFALQNVHTIEKLYSSLLFGIGQKLEGTSRHTVGQSINKTLAKLGYWLKLTSNCPSRSYLNMI